ncbi:lipopolysaccharide biosynthesis protein [Clostridium sp. AM58-1XD]|uniref:lipopolysaccharide biosynthesis protein n=1 Tax=Clostridium sp. AM58-1XD TaxID=2292307 RepID=UPI000E52DB58|nr:lipopolysaccharide biosynthesis protein [Clostridium sp. AM58-1XD]RGY98928.1 lipopolysaccharide biosynthesis protein [Clostridium sp. AM58-1XD]
MTGFVKRFLLYKGNNLDRENVVWNIIGSFCYAFASMVLAFIVMRMAGDEDGGIFAIGFSTFGQQVFIVAYFGIRPFQITDGRNEYSFGDYFRLRIATSIAAVSIAAAYPMFMMAGGTYSPRKMVIVFLLALYKMIDGFADVYESEFQRQGSLYLTGKSNTFRTLLSVFCFLICLGISDSLLAASCTAVAAQAAGVAVFNIGVVNSGILKNICREVKKGAAVRLFGQTWLLFLSVFLDFYIFSSPKYAIDLKMSDAANGYFNIIFMPTSVIYLAANFIIRPFLTKLTDCWNERKFDEFRAIGNKIGMIIGGLTILAAALSVLLGPWALGIMEMILGSDYTGSLTRYHVPFVLIIIGGGLYALANLSYYLLVIMRKQKLIFAVYLVLAVAGWIASPVMVERYGISGAAVCYLILMAVLTAGFTAGQLFCLKKEENQK